MSERTDRLLAALVVLGATLLVTQVIPEPRGPVVRLLVFGIAGVFVWYGAVQFIDTYG